MSSPSTHQDSPKVPEAAVEALMRKRVAEVFGPQYYTVHGWPKFLRDRPADAARYQELAEEDVRAVAPAIFFALLSDEVLEAACDRFEERQKAEGFEFAFPESFMREALEAAIEQVGGGQGA